MATIFEATGLLDILTPIFVFILIFSIIYALLLKSKWFGDNKSFNAIIAFSVALLTMIVPQARMVISEFTGWFVLLAILVLFIFLFFLFLGVKNETMADVAKSGTFVTFAVIFIIVLFLIALTKSFGSFLLVNQEPGFWNAVKRVLFSSRFLGVLLILMIGSYAIRFLSESK